MFAQKPETPCYETQLQLTQNYSIWADIGCVGTGYIAHSTSSSRDLGHEQSDGDRAFLAHGYLTANGKVMVAGGEGFMNSAELFNPHTGTWTNTGAMNTGRWQATATLLHDGKVLVAGGYGGSYGALSSAELYNRPPANG